VHLAQLARVQADQVDHAQVAIAQAVLADHAQADQADQVDHALVAIVQAVSADLVRVDLAASADLVQVAIVQADSQEQALVQAHQPELQVADQVAGLIQLVAVEIPLAHLVNQAVGHRRVVSQSAQSVKSSTI
jgi:hypothetical protein